MFSSELINLLFMSQKNTKEQCRLFFNAPDQLRLLSLCLHIHHSKSSYSFSYFSYFSLLCFVYISIPLPCQTVSSSFHSFSLHRNLFSPRLSIFVLQLIRLHFKTSTAAVSFSPLGLHPFVQPPTFQFLLCLFHLLGSCLCSYDLTIHKMLSQRYTVICLS